MLYELMYSYITTYTDKLKYDNFEPQKNDYFFFAIDVLMKSRNIFSVRPEASLWLKAVPMN